MSELVDAEDAEGSSGGPSSATGGYHFNTPEHVAALKAQRTQLWAWLKSFGSNMFKEGINLTRISLPVCLFEPRRYANRPAWEDGGASAPGLYDVLCMEGRGCRLLL